VTRQRKTLPKKTDNAEVIGQPSHDDSEGTTRISTEDLTWGLEKLPQVLLKYKGNRTAQSRTTTSTKLRIKELKYGHHLMAQAYGTIEQKHNQIIITSGYITYPGPMGAPKPVPESR